MGSLCHSILSGSHPVVQQGYQVIVSLGSSPLHIGAVVMGKASNKLCGGSGRQKNSCVEFSQLEACQFKLTEVKSAGSALSRNTQKLLELTQEISTLCSAFWPRNKTVPYCEPGLHHFQKITAAVVQRPSALALLRNTNQHIKHSNCNHWATSLSESHLIIT